MLKKLIIYCVYYSGVPWIIRNTIAKNKVTIVVYHNPDVESFNKHLKYYISKYNLISLDTLVDSIVTRNWESIKKNSLVITIDDGNKNNYLLLETVKKYNIRPTLYVCPEITVGKKYFWWNITNIKYANIEKYFSKICNKKINVNDNNIMRYKKEFDSYKNNTKHVDRKSLTVKELNSMVEHFDIQSHTNNHPLLPFCENDECYEEVSNSKIMIEELLNHECKHFCFPGGYYTQRELDYVKKCGYKSSRTINVGWNDINTDPYQLKITGVTDGASIPLLVSQLSGITMYFRYLLKGSLKGVFLGT